MRANLAIIAMIFAFALIGNLIGGYLLFFAAGSQNDVATISIKALFLAIATALYAWFMWSHRTPRGVSFRIGNRWLLPGPSSSISLGPRRPFESGNHP